ncbi:MAG: HD domain-containing phosphohydrolase [Atribacterota bacterium]
MNQKESILIVDDNEGIRKSLKLTFNKKGYKTDTAETAQEALKKAHKKYFNIALIEFKLPDMEGTILLSKLKELYPKMTCFIITAYAFLQNVRMAARINADGYFIKPLIPEDVLYRFEEILKEQRIEKELKESEEKYRALFENTGTATMIIEEDRTISMVNTQGEKLSGYSKDEIENKMKWTDFAIPDDMEKMKKYHIFRGKAGEKSPTECEFSFIDRKGNVKDIFLKIGMVPNTKKSIISLMDITKHKISEERLKKIIDAAIDTMSKIVEAKDPYTAGHQRNVSQIATFIAREMKLPQDKIEGIRIASLIHDIGKISVPTEILSKPTTLSDIEFNLIKVHSQIGYDILKSIDFSYPVASVILQHHERLDGSGYPNNLKGDEILLEAKIIGVADVVEAMSSHRPYRPSLGIDAALEEISKNKGALYDSEVVDTCLRLFKKKENLNFNSIIAELSYPLEWIKR